MPPTTPLLLVATLLIGGGPSSLCVADEKEVLSRLEQSRARHGDAAAWARRSAELRRGFLEGATLWPLPARPPVKTIVHGRREYRGYSVENVALETLPGFYCTGNLYRPVGRKDLGPAILCPHGHFRPHGRFRDDHQIRCAHLARMGATVFSYSMVGWDDSSQTTHDDPLVLALQTWNSLRVVDYLTGVARVDPERVGVTGAAGGGTQTMYLSLIDERVKASAPLVIVYPWTAEQRCRCEGGMPVMEATRTNAIELAAASAPRPQLLISLGNDPTQNFPAVGLPFIRHVYGLFGAGDRVKNVHLAGEGHDFGPSKRREVYQFFGRHLKMDVLPEDVKSITIEAPKRLAVFNDEHPLPENALRGSAAIAGTLESTLAKLRTASGDTPGITTLARSPRAEYTLKEAEAADEALIFTPAGFDRPGDPRVATGPEVGGLEIIVRDGETGKATLCRVNVVGADGNFYEPLANDLRVHSLTGVWPKSGWGNRQGKAPARYLGRFFYCDGAASVNVPAGVARVEVWKGLEYRPESFTTQVSTGQTRRVEITLRKTGAMPVHGYWPGDPHIHIRRRDEADEKRILDLLEAEDIHFATILAYNEPAGPYFGFMDRMDSPQYRGLGTSSILTRGPSTIISGQEYRSTTYGHLNLFLLDELVLKGQSLNANDWPVYGQIVREARVAGGVAFYAHGGYAQEVYADVVQGTIDGVELLQFSVYRGIGLIDWYRMLDSGFRVPATGACDYPACRKLGDCRTYVHSESRPTIEKWLRGMAAGESFFTSGPLLLLEVEGHRPGARIELEGEGPHRVSARVRVLSEVVPVTNVQLIASGRIIGELEVPTTAGKGSWLELEKRVELDESAWIAARAFSRSPQGTPAAEAHTNPVYVYLNGKAPYDRAALDGLLGKIDGQIAVHKKRKFAEQARVIAYFERSRDILIRIRAAGGAPSRGHPSDLARGEPTLDNLGSRTHSDVDLKRFLEAVPPKPIGEVLKSFETVGGFQMQLVAREPLVGDPTAGAFDENGNLYVCEMRDYPYKPAPGGQPLGSVRLLKDTDGDGVFDEGHVFAEHLLWPSGVAPWKGGVFVAAAPDIWYLKDTDGDHRADVRRKVYTGFGTQNQQGMLNNLTFGLDHWIYGSGSVNGGDIRPADDPGAPAISVKGRDFRFDPVSGRFETITGTVQYGTTFDDWGERFLCSESQPLQHAVLPQRYLTRNPNLPIPYAVQNIAPGPVPIFRISPLEHWRMIRSSRRIAHGNRAATSAGASHHVIDAAAGVTIYRGGAYPEEYYGNVFIGGAQNNVIHRRVLAPDGVTFTSRRADEGTEFVRSSDNWFRPVNFINAPDGTLHVLDMSREVLEAIHIPLDVVKHLDLKNGRKIGRIYRLAPPGFRFPGSPRIGSSTTADLVAALQSPHGWWRDTAHRLIHEGQDRSAVEPLRRLARTASMPQARLHALWSLHGLDALTDADLSRALDDSHAGIRRHAMRLAETRFDRAPELLEKTAAMADDPDPSIRLQAAFTLGESDSALATTTLARLARTSSSDRWIRTAILSSVTAFADRMLVDLLADPGFVKSPGGAGLLDQLTTVVGARNRAGEVNHILDALASIATTGKDVELARRLLLSLGMGVKRSGARLGRSVDRSPPAVDFLRHSFRQARQTATDAAAKTVQRQQAIRLLGCAPFSLSQETLAGLLDVRQPEVVQIQSVEALSSYSNPDVGDILLARWQQQSPAVRRATVDALLARTDRTRQFLTAAGEGEASIAQIDDTRRSLLLKHDDATIQQLAKKLFARDTASPRATVIAAYRSALTLPGDTARGETIFRRDCMACHRIGAVGHAVGPDLTSSAARDPEALLVHVLDPNRYVLPTYENYLVVDTGGHTYLGIISAQTATSITLTREESKNDTILRTDIHTLASTGKSLMLDGIEKKITRQEMADLITFLQSSRARTPPGEPPLDIGTLPGLIEPKK